MFGISYGELFLLIGATAALVGPKDLPKIAKVAGRLAGRSIGYVQLARGQFDNVMQQSQARQVIENEFFIACFDCEDSSDDKFREVTKELQDTMAQLDAIRHEIRSLSLMNPGPMTRRLMENPPELASDSNGTVPSEKCEEDKNSADAVKKDHTPKSLASTDLHSKATAYARLAESEAVKAGSGRFSVEDENLNYEIGDFSVLPVSAESAGLLPDRKESAKGSDLVLEAVVEAEVAHNAKEFFSLPQNQIQ
ncbi:hypothetical protein Gotri_014076 [Gossypium trilobum]|uniref:Sec-independent protein translocase protein TatB-like n=3 Tax=Gossypium TaxID=3633 RepID=A0A7J9DW08_9ROSI|nr:hypothetical protein [Gossypium davidsonii]MBA0647623.1 hypothetical protein [Gossypium klotzschianum]MBA0764788.1 hypothetical protein [Gossypium trilobum]